MIILKPSYFYVEYFFLYLPDSMFIMYIETIYV